ncbi:hypothetical protein NQ318_008421 [Aromia moschata]|uniref:Uncharacterized protein n=1 Tax=Aromia moschata TaxID=1265417 RepID=A0AAV8YCE9_9CUCU|nr:hypothetical protein NQ318_008421 [Aromia moschata]
MQNDIEVTVATSTEVKQDETKFHYVVANLDPHVVNEVGGHHRRTSITKQGEEIGDRRPSQFIRHLRGLAGTTVHDTILRSLWMSRLPSHAQAILSMDDDVALDKVA